jgi:uncharacterized membrane-anchored protein YhcB (DUF1043 family)
MNVLIAILALVICVVVIAVAMRIYKESPKIRKNADDD